MSGIGLDWGPFDYALIALIIGAPGLLIGTVTGAIAWRRHRLWGAAAGAVAGLILWDAGSSHGKRTRGDEIAHSVFPPS